MKTANPKYSFSKTELQILKEVAKGAHDFSSIESTLGVSPPLLTYNFKKLQNKGLVKATKKAYKKQVFFADFNHAMVLKDLLSVYDYVDWENLLSGLALKILFETIVKEKMEDIPKNTLWRYFKNLKACGIISPANTIAPQFNLLTQFLREYQKFFVNQLVHTISEDSVILWQKDQEFLLRATKNLQSTPKNFFKTALSMFPQYNLPLFSEFDYYFYSTSKKTLKLEDILLHTLLIEPKNVRYTTYALLLLKKAQSQINKAYLLQEASKFNLTEVIINMRQFLSNHTQPEDHSLPTWNEFIAKAEDYKVTTA